MDQPSLLYPIRWKNPSEYKGLRLVIASGGSINLHCQKVYRVVSKRECYLDKKSLETEFSIAIWRQMANENPVSNDFLSVFINF